MSWIHLHLWSVGYKHVHVVGLLFLANFVGGVALGVAVVAIPYRLLSPAAAAGALTAAATLVGLAVSINRGLFGFKESLHAPFVMMSIWVESTAVIVLGALSGRAGLSGRSGSGPSRSGPSSAGAERAGLEE